MSAIDTAGKPSLNESKTRELNAAHESFAFLGWQVPPRRSKSGGSFYQMEPSAQSRGKLMERIRGVLNPGTQWRAIKEVIHELNAMVRGWRGDFRYGHGKAVLAQMHDLMSQRLRTWLWQKARRSHPKCGDYTRRRLREQYGLYAMNQVSTAV